MARVFAERRERSFKHSRPYFETASETTDYRRGFVDCLDLVEDIVGSIKRLKQMKSYLLTVRASMKEKNVVKIREDLGPRSLREENNRTGIRV